MPATQWVLQSYSVSPIFAWLAWFARWDGINRLRTTPGWNSSFWKTQPVCALWRIAYSEAKVFPKQKTEVCEVNANVGHRKDFVHTTFYKRCLWGVKLFCTSPHVACQTHARREHKQSVRAICWQWVPKSDFVDIQCRSKSRTKPNC